MAYVFGCTSGDTQMHLHPQYTADSTDSFVSEKKINHLSFIYEDSFKIQNARLNYKSLNMKTTKTFSAF